MPGSAQLKQGGEKRYSGNFGNLVYPPKMQHVYNSSKHVPMSTLEPIFDPKRTRASPNKAEDPGHFKPMWTTANQNAQNHFMSNESSYPMTAGYGGNYQNMPMRTSGNYYMGMPNQMQPYPMYQPQPGMYSQGYMQPHMAMGGQMKSNSEVVHPQHSLSSKNINYGPGSAQVFNSSICMSHGAPGLMRQGQA